MVARPLDAEIDRLYQVAPDAFTAARNALAKTAGADGAAIKALPRPAVAAWAVNQLYWRKRDAYDALVHAAGEVRQAHRGVLAGRGGDVRAAGKAHEAALDRAMKATLGLLDAGGQKVTDATRQAVTTTLRTLPAGERAGRLTAALQPGGFEMFAGLAAPAGSPSTPLQARAHPGPSAPRRPAVKRPAPPAEGRSAVRTAPAPASRQPSAREKAALAKAAAREREIELRARAAARAAAAEAGRALRRAEHDAQREAFEAARAAREAARADARLKRAREALEDARREVEAAGTAAAGSAAAKEQSEARSSAAAKALEAARASVSPPSEVGRTSEKL